MELTFLGTSSGVPTKTRNVSGLAIKLTKAKPWVLVDCGEGTQHQILRTPLSLIHLKAIFITHVHGDHCYGLPGLIASAGMSGRTEPLYIIAPPAIEKMFSSIQSATQLFIPFEIKFVDADNFDPQLLGSVSVSPIPLSHRVPSNAFCFTFTQSRTVLLHEKLLDAGIPKGAAWGKLQRGIDLTLDDGTQYFANDFVESVNECTRLVIAGDNDDPSCLAALKSPIDILVHEATYTEEALEKVGSGPQHSSAKRIASFAENHHIPNLLLTHFSARYHENYTKPGSLKEIESEARQHYNGNLYLARDLDCYTLHGSTSLVKKELTTKSK